MVALLPFITLLTRCKWSTLLRVNYSYPYIPMVSTRIFVNLYAVKRPVSLHFPWFFRQYRGFLAFLAFAEREIVIKTVRALDLGGKYLFSDNMHSNMGSKCLKQL